MSLAIRASGGATLVIAGLPAGFYVSLGFAAFCVGPRFRGIRDIPCGVTLLFRYYVEEHVQRGFMVEFAVGEVMLLRWTGEELEFALETGDLVECLSHGELLPHLAVYQGDDTFPTGLKVKTSRRWLRTDGADGVYSSAMPPTFQEMSSKLTPSLRTQLLRERSELALEYVASRDLSLTEWVYEVETAFIVFLAMHSFDAFEFWRVSLEHICASPSALRGRSAISVLVGVVGRQLDMAGSGDADEIFGEAISSLHASFDVQELYARARDILGAERLDEEEDYVP